jgi:catechol 2,3-dioxygenase-like lactoylglutathione lyase family enzyme
MGQRVTVDRANTVLYCERWAETAEFYRTVLGFEVEFENDWFVEFRVSGDAYVSIADVGRATIEPARGRGVTLTLRTPEARAAHAVLAERGVEVSPMKRRFGADVFYCHDPEGHRLEFWSP